jgi:tRNA(Met) C34 N-acetyltransferase TmcA
MGIARQENSKIFDSALEYVKSKNPNEKRPIIKAFYTSGDPGGGKSRVIARNIANYIEEGDVWLAAPKITQANTLLESVGKGFKFTIKETDTSVIPNLFEKCQMDIRAINDAQDKLKLFRSDQEAMEAYA